mgnify:CR=1 FL=1
MKSKKSRYNDVIVVSAVNLVDGGTFTILKNCLQQIVQENKYSNYKIIALVHSKRLFEACDKIEYMEFPLAKKNYVFRIFYEYIFFYFLSRQIRPRVWLSLHDITPTVYAEHRYVYMHNSSPLYKGKKGERLSSKFRFFTKFYKYVYRINVKRNDYVIVQQAWFRKEIARICRIPEKKIVVAYPEFNKTKFSSSFIKNMFTFPAFPREFKNFEVICKAADVLASDGSLPGDWTVRLTVDGSENFYSKKIVDSYMHNPHIKFTGILNYVQMQALYNDAECLIFPSWLETWGLPISEFKTSGKKMILADLPYAHEAANGAESVAFFEPDSVEQLAALMKTVILGDDSGFSKNEVPLPEPPFCKSWKDLIGFIG